MWQLSEDGCNHMKIHVILLVVLALTVYLLARYVRLGILMDNYLPGQILNSRVKSRLSTVLFSLVVSALFAILFLTDDQTAKRQLLGCIYSIIFSTAISETELESFENVVLGNFKSSLLDVFVVTALMWVLSWFFVGIVASVIVFAFVIFMYRCKISAVASDAIYFGTLNIPRPNSSVGLYVVRKSKEYRDLTDTFLKKYSVFYGKRLAKCMISFVVLVAMALFIGVFENHVFVSRTIEWGDVLSVVVGNILALVILCFL